MNKEEFMDKYYLSNSDNINPYLAEWNKKCRQVRPVIPEQFISTVCQSGKTAQIWVQSDACRYSIVGACTCCDYFQGSRNVDQLKAFKQALVKMRPDSDTIVLNTCGSVLDESELKHKNLLRIMDSIQDTQITTLVLETHMGTIDDEILSVIYAHRGKLDIYFEIGIETLNEEVNRFILNKLPFDRDIKGIINLIHSWHFKVTGNVMTGFPFMSRDFQIEDSYRTIKTLLAYGIDFMVLFPINIKRYTLMYKLYENHLYSVTDGRILTDILLKFAPDELEYINVGWYGEPRIEIPGYSERDMVPPYYCENCREKMMGLWLNYNCEPGGQRRLSLLEQMKTHKCKCNFGAASGGQKMGIDYEALDIAYQFLQNEEMGNKI